MQLLEATLRKLIYSRLNCSTTAHFCLAPVYDRL